MYYPSVEENLEAPELGGVAVSFLDEANVFPILSYANLSMKPILVFNSENNCSLRLECYGRL